MSETPTDRIRRILQGDVTQTPLSLLEDVTGRWKGEKFKCKVCGDIVLWDEYHYHTVKDINKALSRL